MTSGADPIVEVLRELRELREAVQNGITAAVGVGRDVDGLRDDLSDTNAKSDRRARTFRWMWTGGTALFVAAVVTAAALFYLGYQSVKRADEQLDCFQAWANATAERTQTLSTANDKRLAALDHALDVRSHHMADSPVSRRAVTAAAKAGDAYERVARLHPPVPPEQVYCAQGLQAVGPAPSSAAATSASSTGTARRTGSSPAATALSRSAVNSTSPASHVTVTRTAAPSTTTANVAPTTTTPRTSSAPRTSASSTPNPLRSLTCGVIGLITTCPPEGTP